MHESNGIIELLVVGRPKRMESSLEDHFASAKPPGSGKDIVHVTGVFLNLASK
jgi:hypothetical protein